MKVVKLIHSTGGLNHLQALTSTNTLFAMNTLMLTSCTKMSTVSSPKPRLLLRDHALPALQAAAQAASSAASSAGGELAFRQI